MTFKLKINKNIENKAKQLLIFLTIVLTRYKKGVNMILQNNIKKRSDENIIAFI